jgi:lambda family phage portal protein
MSLVSRALALVSPARALKRQALARAVNVLNRPVARYDGAGGNHRMAWRLFSRDSAVVEVHRSLERLRAVSRDMARNNAYAARAVSALSSNVVGEGIIPAVKSDAKRTIKAVQDAIEAHCDTTAIDFEGRNTLYGLQALAMRAIAESGECLLIRRRASSGQGFAVPVQVQVLEADYLDTSRDTHALNTGGAIISGIEFDRRGQRVAYHLFRQHPGSSFGFGESVRMPASDVIHLYRVDRPGQLRGVPWLSPAMMTLWDLHRYEEAELVRQEIAACFAAFVTDGTGELALEAAKNAEPASGAGLAPRETLEPGTIQYLKTGSAVTFGQPPQVQSYDAFVRAHLRKVSVAVGIPFEVLAGDLSQVNFSSGRMGWLEFQRLIQQWRYQLLIPHFCDGVGAWFSEALNVVQPRLSPFRIEWTPPKREMIQPKEEVEADIAEMRAGLVSRQEKVRARGYDPEKVDAEIAEDNSRADAAGLSFDSDGRRPRNGPAQTNEAPPGANGA